MSSQFSTLKIDNLDDPELAPYKTLRRPMEHLVRGIFVAEGEKVVRRLLESHLAVHSLLMTPAWLESLSRRTFAHRPRLPNVFLGEQPMLESIVGYNLHQGIMGIGQIPPAGELNEFLTGAGEPVLLVALDGLVSAENVGVVVRNCAAFGVTGIVTGETSSSPWLRRAVRNSMGAVFTLPVFHSRDLAPTLAALRADHGFTIIGAAPQGTTTIYDVPFGKKTCLVLGNEGEGISEQVRAACSTLASVPMQNNTDSINVASASAVFLYEFARLNAAARR